MTVSEYCPLYEDAPPGFKSDCLDPVDKDLHFWKNAISNDASSDQHIAKQDSAHEHSIESLSHVPPGTISYTDSMIPSRSSTVFQPSQLPALNSTLPVSTGVYPSSCPGSEGAEPKLPISKSSPSPLILGVAFKLFKGIFRPDIGGNASVL